MRYLPLTDADRRAMLGVIGAVDVDALFRDVPLAARLSAEEHARHAAFVAKELGDNAVWKKVLATA